MSTPVEGAQSLSISVRPMQEGDLVEARRICSVAFGTFLGLPDPEAAQPGREYVFTRWRANPAAALVAEADGGLLGSNLLGSKLLGSNFATHWGSFGFFGPLTVRPDLWGRGVAQKLLGSTMDLFEKWGVRDAGLYTFAQSPKHIGLYQKFGFWPRFLTAVMSKKSAARETAALQYSALKDAERQQVLGACRKLTDCIHEGLDVSSEIRSVADQNLGDTILLWGGGSLEGFAVCHGGEGTEAGPNTCYLKFAAARPGAGAERAFERLLDGCEAFAAGRGLERMEAGVNLGRSQAYRHMLQRGFRADMQGVAMHKPDSPAYNRPDVFVVDDWR